MRQTVTHTRIPQPSTPTRKIVGSAGAEEKQDKRRGELAIPINIRQFLNEDQMLSLRQMEGFGWHLMFIRRPLFQDPQVILGNADETILGTLSEDGDLDTDTDVPIRH